MIDISSLLIIISAGVIAGMFTGLLPGLGPSSLLLILYPWLTGIGILELFVFYSVLMASAQYYGSISAIIYAVPGEITSTPAVQYGHPEFRKGQGAELLASTATASLVASLVGLFVFYIAQMSTDFLSLFINNTPRLILLSVILLSIFFIVKNKVVAMLAIVAGVLTGQIGFNVYVNDYFLSSATFLSGGVPMIPLFLGFLVIPDIIKYIRPGNITNAATVNMLSLTFKSRIKNLFNFQDFISSIRGSSIGAIAGLIPSVGTSISSIIAANIEKHLSQHPRQYVVSAEAANNAAAITVLIPLIILALPIVPSEAIILGLAERQGFGATTSFDTLAAMGTFLISILLAVNLLNWILAGVFYQLIARLYFVLSGFIYHIIIFFCAVMVIYTGHVNNQIELYLIISAIGFVGGMFLRSFDVRLAFVFAFFLSDSLFQEIYRFVLFHF